VSETVREERGKTMSIELREGNEPTSGQAIAELENALSIALPEAYRSFLMNANGGRPLRPVFPIAGMHSNPTGHVNFFFGIGASPESYDLQKTNEFYALPKGIVLIAENGMGDYVCLDLRNGKEHVVFWDHRHFWGTGEWREKDLYHIARSFGEFLASLRPWSS